MRSESCTNLAETCDFRESLKSILTLVKSYFMEVFLGYKINSDIKR